MLLALSLGYRSIREFKQGMKAREWEELKALGRMERIGQERKDWGVWAIAASMGFKGSVEDLFPFARVKEQQTPDQIVSQIRSMVTPSGSQHSNPSD